MDGWREVWVCAKKKRGDTGCARLPVNHIPSGEECESRFLRIRAALGGEHNKTQVVCRINPCWTGPGRFVKCLMCAGCHLCRGITQV